MPDSDSFVSAPGRFVPRAAVSFGTDGTAATAVDDAHPLPIASGAPSSATASIANTTALSAAVDLGAQRLHRIALPAGWTAAAISFQSSFDGSSWADLYDANGEVTLAAAVVAANRAIVVDPAPFLGIRYLKIRSGTAATPVNQAAQRDLTLVTVAR